MNWAGSFAASAGISIVLDDFGNGYPSLSYLFSLPQDVLKIDKLFIPEVARKPLAQKIARGC